MRFLFTCGGTAGHIYPAIAVAGRLAALYPESEFLFVGANGKMEMELVAKEGYDITGIDITNICRTISLNSIKHNVNTVKNVINSVKYVKQILDRFKPNVVVGTGGYVCYPVIIAAASMGIPTAVHESNAVPGLTTKLLSRKVDKIMVGFQESREYYKNKDKVVITGTPVRGDFYKYDKATARRELGLSPDEQLVLSVWGSLGSGHMNSIVPKMISIMKSDGFRLIHATGSAYYNSVISKMNENNIVPADHNANIERFLYNMPCLMAAADLIMCRAGASTLAELAYAGKPAILIPSPNVANNHQEKNSRVVENNGGAVVMLEGEFNAETLFDNISSLLTDKSRLRKMSEAQRTMSYDSAADEIARIIIEMSV